MRTLSPNDIENITNLYYSSFCGTDISKLKNGVHFICSQNRDAELTGFGCKYTMFILVQNDLCVVSYSPKYSDFIDSLQGCSSDEIIITAAQTYNLIKKQLMIFGSEVVTQYGKVRILRNDDYPLYEEFFRAVNPDADSDGWLK